MGLTTERNIMAQRANLEEVYHPLHEAYETPYVLLDARYERVREAGQVVDCAVLVPANTTCSCCQVNADDGSKQRGRRQPMGVAAKGAPRVLESDCRYCRQERAHVLGRIATGRGI